MSGGTLDPVQDKFVFGYVALTLCGGPSHALLLTNLSLLTVRTPVILLPQVWPPPLSLATTRGISVDVFSSSYLDVSVQAVPLIQLFGSLYDTLKGGFPHSDISGS